MRVGWSTFSPGPNILLTNPDWLRMQNLGHTKCSSRVLVCSEQYARERARFARAQTSATSISPVNYGGSEEHADSCVHSAEIQTDETAKEITYLRTELNTVYETITNVRNKIVSLEPFTEANFQGKSNENIVHYTGLPNFKVLKVIFDFVAPRSFPATTKLACFQEFIIVLLKLHLNVSLQTLHFSLMCMSPQLHKYC